MKLTELLNDIENIEMKGSLEKDINKIENNSKNIEKDDLFICLKGALFDGHNYIQEAIKSGANTIVVEDYPEYIIDYPEITFIKTNNTRDLLSKLASSYYRYPTKNLKLIGVTGTKGKTTVTQMILNSLEEAGVKVGSISTQGIYYNNNLISTNNTTPDALEIQKALREMVDLGYTHVVLEASSQGFKQKRLDDMQFDVGVFLNIEPDHIGKNEHANFEEYFNCKKEIFTRSKAMVVNKDPEVWKYISEIKHDNLITYSTTSDNADYYVNNIEYYKEPLVFGTTSTINGKDNNQLKLVVPGVFNISNAMAALAVIKELGINTENFYKAMSTFHTEGRTHLLESAVKKGRTVFIDYGHNKLSVGHFLESLKKYNPKRLVVMFSYEFYETFSRHYEMGYTIGSIADEVILTSNSLGNYTFEELFENCIRGLEDSKANYTIIRDRTEAIHHTMDITDKDDIIAFFGMGNCFYTIIDGEKIPYYEEEVVNTYLDQLNSQETKK